MCFIGIGPSFSLRRGWAVVAVGSCRRLESETLNHAPDNSLAWLSSKKQRNGSSRPRSACGVTLATPSVPIVAGNVATRISDRKHAKHAAHNPSCLLIDAGTAEQQHRPIIHPWGLSRTLDTIRYHPSPHLSVSTHKAEMHVADPCYRSDACLAREKTVRRVGTRSATAAGDSLECSACGDTVRPRVAAAASTLLPVVACGRVLARTYARLLGRRLCIPDGSRDGASCSPLTATARCQP